MLSFLKRLSGSRFSTAQCDDLSFRGLLVFLLAPFVICLASLDRVCPRPLAAVPRAVLKDFFLAPVCVAKRVVFVALPVPLCPRPPLSLMYLFLTLQIYVLR